MKSPLPKLAKDFAALVGIARKEASPAVIETALADARTQVAGATAEREAAEASYRDGLLDASPAESERQLAAASAAKVKVDRAEALVAALTQRLIGARQAEEQARRLAIYESARAKAEAARAALLQDYPAICRQTLSLLRTLAEAELAVKGANAALPADASPIISPEAQVRIAPWAAIAEDWSDPMELWAPAGGGEPLPADDQGSVRPTPGLHPWKGTLHRADGSTLECHLRSYRRIVTREMPRDEDRSNLAGGIHLPSLHPFTPPFWQADRGPFGYHIDRDPDATLDALAKVEPLSAAVWHQPDPAGLREIVRYEEVGRPVELQPQSGAAPSAFTTGVSSFTPPPSFRDSPVKAFGGRR